VVLVYYFRSQQLDCPVVAGSFSRLPRSVAEWAGETDPAEESSDPLSFRANRGLGTVGVSRAMSVQAFYIGWWSD
jgi:hypothetical protein